MAGETIRPGRRAPSWTQRLHEEELSGFAFAFKTRCRDLGLQPIVGHQAPIHIIAIDRRPNP